MPSHRTIRYSVWSLLALTSCICLFFGWLKCRLVSLDDESFLRAELERAGATVLTSPIEPVVLHQLLGSRRAVQIAIVRFTGNAVTDDDLQVLADCSTAPRLREVIIRDAQKVTDAGLQHLASLSQVETIDLSGTPIHGQGLRALARCNRLRCLRLNRTAVRDAAFEAIADLDNLAVLDLNDTPISGEGFRHLRKMDHLEEISLQRTCLSEDGLLCVSQLPHVARLDLKNARLSGTGVQYLGGMESLGTLDLSDASVPITALLGMSTPKSLRNLALDGLPLCDEHVSRMDVLRQPYRLSLERTAVSDVGLEHLKECKQLTFIFLSGSNTTEGGAMTLSKATGAAVCYDGRFIYFSSMGTSSHLDLDPVGFKNTVFGE